MLLFVSNVEVHSVYIIYQLPPKKKKKKNQDLEGQIQSPNISSTTNPKIQ